MLRVHIREEDRVPPRHRQQRQILQRREDDAGLLARELGRRAAHGALSSRPDSASALDLGADGGMRLVDEALKGDASQWYRRAIPFASFMPCCTTAHAPDGVKKNAW